MTKLPAINPTAARLELARRRLLDFTRHTFDGYRTGWHHAAYAATLDKFARGEIQRLMVRMPPQHGKSELCSRRLPAYLLGINPDLRIAVCAYNHPFAAKFNRDTQRIITSQEYAELFPDTTLFGKNTRTVADGGTWLRNADEFEIVGHTGSLVSVGIGGPLTGRKVDVAIIDDPYKGPEDAWSEAGRRKVREWWWSVLRTRLNDRSQICLTFTPWHHDDIGMELLRNEPDKWTVVNFPAIKEGEPTEHDPRQPGEALWPEEHGIDKLLDLQASAPSMFQSLYQLNPTNPGGDKIKRDWFFVYERVNLPEGVNHFYIDTALSDQELKHNDPSGILIGRVHKGRLHLVHYEEGHWGLPDLCKKIEDLHSYHGKAASRIYIENKANGRSVKQQLQTQTRLNIVLDNPKGGKEFRVEEVLHHLESGKIGVPLGDNWVEAWMQQVTTFPKAAHDEGVDTLTGLIRRTLNVASGVQFANPISR
jgi:predicted phage terminase large subunit-like protein